MKKQAKTSSKTFFAQKIVAKNTLAKIAFTKKAQVDGASAKHDFANNKLAKNRRAKHLARALLICLLPAAFTAHAQSTGRVSIEDRGLDGAIRYYSVRCDDAQRLALEHHFKSQEFCFMTDSGLACLRSGDAERAAQLACVRAPGGE